MTHFRPEGPALTIAVGGRRFALAAGAVRRVGTVGPLTRLPFVPGWIEGLTGVGGRPMLQIDPIGALGGAWEGERGEGGDKLVVVDAPGGAVALRVDRVEPATASAPSLAVEALVGDLEVADRRGGTAAAAATAADGAAGEPAAIVLVVASGTARLGVLLDEGVSVGEVAASRRIDTGDGDEAGQLMATVNDRLLPARRLSDEGGAGRAVIGPTADGPMAVLVDRLIGLEHVPLERLVPLPGAAPGRNLCFPLAGGGAVCLQDFEALAGRRGAVGAAYRHLLERIRERRERAPQRPASEDAAGGDAGGGLTVSVRGVRWLLPLALVDRMLGVDERLPEEGPPDRRPAAGRGAALLLDAGRWFSAGTPPASGGAEAVLLRLPGGGRIALRVDRIALEPAGAATPWLPPPPLPPELAALVDGVRAEPETGLWCLRLAASLDPAALPPSLRRAILAARLGRLTPADALRTNLQGT